MLTIKKNNVLFKGQYAEALQSLLNGNTITLSDFHNGSWEGTKQIGEFISRVKCLKGLNVQINGNSLRSTTIQLA